MLVLTRRVGQKILLPELRVAVQVVSVQGKDVRLGVDAPRCIQVVREELVRVRDEQRLPVEPRSYTQELDTEGRPWVGPKRD